jgi:hypothetical protein
MSSVFLPPPGGPRPRGSLERLTSGRVTSDGLPRPGEPRPRGLLERLAPNTDQSVSDDECDEYDDECWGLT